MLAIQPLADAIWKRILDQTSGLAPPVDTPRTVAMLRDPLGWAILGSIFLATTLTVFVTLTWWNRRHA